MMPRHFVVNDKHAPFNEYYLQRLQSVVEMARHNHTRTLAVMLLLRLPDYQDTGDSIANNPATDTKVMTRFIEALNARIDAYQHRRQKAGKRVNVCQLTYAWVREYGEQGKPHYHAVLFVNNDTFRGLGDYRHCGDNLGSFIEEAWCSALGLGSVLEYRTLVHFPDNPLYYLDPKAPGFNVIKHGLLCRLSYLAKERSKIYSKEVRSFGCSQWRRG